MVADTRFFAVPTVCYQSPIVKQHHSSLQPLWSWLAWHGAVKLIYVGHGGVGGVCPVSFETSVEELGLSSTGQLS